MLPFHMSICLLNKTSLREPFWDTSFPTHVRVLDSSPFDFSLNLHRMFVIILSQLLGTIRQHFHYLCRVIALFAGLRSNTPAILGNWNTQFDSLFPLLSYVQMETNFHSSELIFLLYISNYGHLHHHSHLIKYFNWPVARRPVLLFFLIYQYKYTCIQKFYHSY